MPTEGLHPVNDQPFIRLSDFSLHPKIILCRDETGQGVNIAHIYGPDGTFIESKPAVTGNDAQAHPALVGNDVFATHKSGVVIPEIFKNGNGWQDYTSTNTLGSVVNTGAIASNKKDVYAGHGNWLWKFNTETGALTESQELSQNIYAIAVNGPYIVVNHSSKSLYNPEDPSNAFKWPRKTVLYNADYSEVATLDVGDPDTINTGKLGPVAINQDRCALAHDTGTTFTIEVFDLTGTLKDTIISTVSRSVMLLMSNTKLFLGDWENSEIHAWDITDDGAGNKTYTAAPTITIDGGLFYGNLSTG